MSSQSYGVEEVEVLRQSESLVMYKDLHRYEVGCFIFLIYTFRVKQEMFSNVI